jgi:PAS domain S-box-containing protein
MGGNPSSEKLQQLRNEDNKKAAGFSQVEEILRVSGERFLSIYEQTPLGYQSLDEAGHLVDVNEAWLDMLGYTREEVIGNPFGNFLHPEWQEHCRENLSRFLAIGEMLGVELEMVRKDGGIITVFFNGKIICDHKGNIKQTHFVLRDITGRKQAEDDAERLFDELQAARGEIQTLRQLLPVCSECGTYCNDNGFHHRVEAYRKLNSDVQVGSALCPACKK